ncbi:hypothetical protein B0H21DRAFT_840758, partial [Amylocystis lapponica]
PACSSISLAQSACCDSRELTPLETFSRAIRNYVPSSIPIPSAAPSPPRVSRPVSFGSFLTPAMSPRIHARDASIPDTWKRRGSDVAGARPDQHWSTQRGVDLGEEAAVFNLDDEVVQRAGGEEGRVDMRYPGVGDAEEILWAGWDTLAEDRSAKSRCVAWPRCATHFSYIFARRLLMLGYATGLQVWDCSNLGSVSEILNLSGAPWGSVELVGVLPDPVDSKADLFRTKRPLIGILSRTGEWPDFVVYSLRTHEIVKTMSFSGLTSFSAASHLIVLSTSNPPNIYVLSSCTLATLYTVSSTFLVPFASSPSIANPNPNVSQVDLEQTPAAHQYHLDSIPQPVFALSHRLLAFASPLTPHDNVSLAGGASRISGSSGSDNALKLGLGMSQAEFGTAAVKLGGSVLSGMKSLGGMAISAARAGVTAAVAGDQVGAAKTSSGGGGLGTRFFSKSAPADSGRGHERRHSLATPDGGRADPFPSRAAEEILRVPVTGCNVTVLDLRPLLAPSSHSSATAKPEKVAEFLVSKQEPISRIVFSADGTSLAVSLRDGHVTRVFQLHPFARALRVLSDRQHGPDEGVGKAQQELPVVSHLEPPAHVYNLRRGRTTASVEGLEWARDGRWFAIGTRKRTLHVFAVNPYGGRADDASHFLGKVVNAPELQPLPTDLSPVVRLRTAKIPSPESHCAPLAFTFVQSSQSSLPPALLPPVTMHYSTSSSPSSRARRPANFQDLLKFDPYDGTLVLCRISLERSNSEQNPSSASSFPAVGGTSISFPGIGNLGRLSTSPASSGNSPHNVSGLTQMMEKPAELVARESQVGTWNLRRGKNWPEVRQVLGGCARSKPQRPPKTDWLSHAELSTSSVSPRILPRSLYLSHQFSFYSFGEDYHALIRSHHFDVPAAKVEVRREVEVSAYSTGMGESFVQDLSMPHDVGRVSSSFDEPLASALAADMTLVNPSSSPIPMYPNGTPSSTARALKSAVPIRSVTAGLSDTMSESLVRLRREMRRVRSARRAQQRLDGAVPLEFAEEDEDLFGDALALGAHDGEAGMSRSLSRGGDSGESVSTPSTNLDPLPAEAEEGGQGWAGWEAEDQEAVEDAERFDDISVGFMDEEQAEMREAEKKRMKGR